MSTYFYDARFLFVHDSKSSLVVQLALMGRREPSPWESFAAEWQGQFRRDANRIVLWGDR